MSYINNFKTTDDLVSHFQNHVPCLTDEFLKAKYTGFLVVNAITTYEIAIKEIFIDFAKEQNEILCTFVSNYFYRINGKIKIDKLKEYIGLFGEKYLNEFKNELTQIQNQNIISNYSNLIVCRNKYVHEGDLTLTFQEVVDNYNIGKKIIEILYDIMQK